MAEARGKAESFADLYREMADDVPVEPGTGVPIIDNHPFHGIGLGETRHDRNWHRDGVTRKRADGLARMRAQERIDLHGCRLEQAFADLEEFIVDALSGGCQVVEVVHGKGSGTIKLAARGWLSACQWVLAYAEPPRNSGSILVLLKTDGK